MEAQTLSQKDHSRNSAGLTYVYPVLSRRAGGVSLGINLNPNKACNWACAYCQVENLVRGKAPKLDLNRLGSELRGFLSNLDSYFEERVPVGSRSLRDVAFSGDGEATTSDQFEEAVIAVKKVLDEFLHTKSLPLRLITNGSLLHQEKNVRALDELAERNGEVWFKIDSVLSSEIEKINGTKPSLERLEKNLKISASHCPTFIQTCLVAWDGTPPSRESKMAYVQFLEKMIQEGVQVRGVFLYTLAREPKQPNSAKVSSVSFETLQDWKDSLGHLDLLIQVNT